MRLLHVTSDYRDPISHILSQQDNIISISVAELINKVTIFDSCNQKGASINWEYKDYKISNDSETYLLSRVSYISDKIMEDFSVADRDYVQAEIEAYLGFAFHAFNKINYDIDERGYLKCYSLPHQWEKLKSMDISITTPNYYWGDPRFIHFEKTHLIYSDIYNYYIWSKKHSLKAEENVTFCYEEPVGVPIICLVINNSSLITNLTSNKEVNEDHIKYLGEMIAKKFNYFISEILFFVTQEKIAFSCITPYIIQSHENIYFKSFVQDKLNKVMN